MNYQDILQDRLDKIRQVIDQYGEENFFISFSGGMDSTVCSELVDMALPHNRIPRVFADTGIELQMIRSFVREKHLTDDRIVIIKPTKNIRQMLEEEGYPFKSKYHSVILDIYQRKGMESVSVRTYTQAEPPRSGIRKHTEHLCPNILKEQFQPEYGLRVSAKCCDRLKKDPIKKWQKENGKKYAILGLMASEGGQRESVKCLAFERDKLTAFQPLAVLNKEWERWFIDNYNIDICRIYYPPYNFTRTGCKGCPFNLKIQDHLDTLEKYFPTERKQCEIIWKPVYDEYRRLGYRLRKET